MWQVTHYQQEEAVLRTLKVDSVNTKVFLHDSDDSYCLRIDVYIISSIYLNC